MQHVCRECGEIIEHMGYPAARMIDIVSKAYFKVGIVLYHSVLGNSPIPIDPILRYLESWELLVSTEIDKYHIQIMPNMNLCYVDHFRGELCWCGLFDIDNNDDDEYEPSAF